MRSLSWLALVALALSAGVLVWYLGGRSGEEAAIEQVGPLERGPAASEAELKPLADRSPQGGTFGGIVVDDAGRPVDGAHVLLVRYETGEGLSIPQFKPDGSDFDAALLPRVGAYEVTGETRTDGEGRFRVTASAATDRVKMVVAWTEMHAPAFVFTGAPKDEVRVVLRSGGHLKGTVLDPEGRPVQGALVQVFLQQIAPKALAPDPGQPGKAVVPERTATAAAPLLGDFLGRVVGPRVYGIDPSRNESFQLATRSDGTFQLGPVDGTVQLEVVISHRDYMWTDFDEDEQGFVHRPVLKPGQTLERTYRLRVGNWIEGRIVSDQDPTQGIEGVVLRVRHPVAYKKHHFYEFKTRNAVTSADGSFRVAGLSHGPYAVDLFHPSFGSDFQGQVPANTKNLLWAVKSRGALEGTLVGLKERPPGGRVEVVLEPAGEKGARTTTQRVVAKADEQGIFVLERLDPGTYRVSVRAGTLVSPPQEITILPRELVRASFEAGAGGGLVVEVRDGAGRPVDPVTVTLLRLEGENSSALGTFITRQGRIEEEGVTPGRYRLEAAAVGFLPGASEPFDVEADRTLRVPAIVLLRPASVRVASIKDERGQGPAGDVHLEVREGEGPFRPLLLRTGEASVRPGSVTFRARDGAGRGWSETLTLGEGEQRQIEVVLRPE